MSEDLNKDQIDYDKSQLNKEYPAGTFLVTKEEVSMYCNSIGDLSIICQFNRVGKEKIEQIAD